MTITVEGPGVAARNQFESADYGNLRVVEASIELAALAQNGVAGILKVAPYHNIIGVAYKTDALGANTGLTFGYETVDGATSAALLAVANTSSAGDDMAHVFPVSTGASGAYITATQSGAGAATGTVQVYLYCIKVGY